MNALSISLRVSALSLTLATAANAQPQIARQHNGTASNERFGGSLALLGDLDGDSVRDYAIGAPNGSTGGLSQNGYVNIYSGATGALITPVPLSGGTTNAHFGLSICNLPDITGDGVDEFVIGEPNDYTLPGSGPDGQVFVYDGATRFPITVLTPTVTTGGGMSFGYSVCTANTDGMGTWEILVGAPHWDGSVNGNFQGAVYVFSALGASITGFTGFANSNLGWSVSNIGDVGTGAHSVVAGAPAFSGGTSLIEVYQGNLGGAPTWFEYIPDYSGINFGHAVSGIDLVHSGTSSGFVVGSLFGNQVHGYQVNLTSGYFDWMYTKDGRPGSAFSQTMGAALAPAGDVNGDGVSDWVAGTSSAGSGIGYARVHSGDTGAKLNTHYGKRAANDSHAEAVCSAADWNGDGLDSILIGAPGWENNSGTVPPNAGRVVLVDL